MPHLDRHGAKLHCDDVGHGPETIDARWRGGFGRDRTSVLRQCLGA